jgi:hypothetical protein
VPRVKLSVIFGQNSMMRPLILMLLLASAASSQDHPNFTGTWKRDNSRSTIRPGSTIQYSNKVDHQESKLSVTTILGANGERKESRYTREYIIGGELHVTTDREGDPVYQYCQVGRQFPGV